MEGKISEPSKKLTRERGACADVIKLNRGFLKIVRERWEIEYSRKSPSPCSAKQKPKCLWCSEKIDEVQR